MGNQPTSSFQQATWKQVDSKGVRIILQNQQTLNSVEKYLTTFQSAQFPSPQQVYKWRAQLSPQWHVIQMYQYGVKKGGICNGFDQYYVITQRCHRLNQIPHFSKPEAFLIIKQTIIAIRKISQKYGLFSPNIQKIGINQQGQVRLWINQNYASNILQDDPQGHPKLEQAVVNNLCRLIKNRVYNNQLKGEYPFHMNFNKALKYITEYMKNDRNFMIQKVYKDRDHFTKEYSAKRQQFSRTRSRQLLSQFSRSSKIIEDHSLLNYSKKSQKDASKKIIYHDFNNQVTFYHAHPLITQKNGYENQSLSIKVKNSYIHNQFFEQIHTSQKNQKQIISINNSNNNTTNNERLLNHTNSLKQIKAEKVNQRYSSTKIQAWGKKSYDTTNNNFQINNNDNNKLVVSKNRMTQKKLSYKNHYPPKPVNSNIFVKNKNNIISQKSQIRIDNNLQLVDSQIFIQDNEDSLLDQVRDNVPFN